MRHATSIELTRADDAERRDWNPVTGTSARPSASQLIVESTAVALCSPLPHRIAGRAEESSMDPVTAAIAAGAAAGLTASASQAVLDAYEALKSALHDRYPRVDVGPLEELPDSEAKQASLAEDLTRYGAARDTEVVRLAFTLVAVIAREVPQAASRVGVDLERVKGEFVNIQRVEGGVKAHDLTTTGGGITITDVRAGGGPDPNR